MVDLRMVDLVIFSQNDLVKYAQIGWLVSCAHPGTLAKTLDMNRSSGPSGQVQYHVAPQKRITPGVSPSGLGGVEESPVDVFSPMIIP